MKNVLLSMGLVALLGLASCGSDTKTETPAYTPDALDVADDQKKVIVSEYTGTWCPYCGQWGKAVIDASVDSIGANAIKVAFNMAAGRVDPLYVRDNDAFNDFAGITGYPSQSINFVKINSSGTIANLINDIIAEGKGELSIKPSAVVGLKFVADSLNPGSYIINTRTRITKDLPEGKYNVGVYILQDSLVYDQATIVNNASALIKNYKHTSVFRKTCKNAEDGITAAWGTTFTSTGAKVGERFEKTFTVVKATETNFLKWVPSKLKAMVVVYQMNASGTKPAKVLNAIVATLSK